MALERRMKTAGTTASSTQRMGLRRQSRQEHRSAAVSWSRRESGAACPRRRRPIREVLGKTAHATTAAPTTQARAPPRSPGGPPWREGRSMAHSDTKCVGRARVIGVFWQLRPSLTWVRSISWMLRLGRQVADHGVVGHQVVELVGDAVVEHDTELNRPSPASRTRRVSSSRFASRHGGEVDRIAVTAWRSGLSSGTWSPTPG